MANEITDNMSFSVVKGGVTAAMTLNLQRTLTGVGAFTGRQTIGTSAEALVFPSDLTTEGMTKVTFKNEDSTNYVELALDSGMTNIFAKIPAGQGMTLCCHTGNPTYYARANTAAITLAMVASGT